MQSVLPQWYAAFLDATELLILPRRDPESVHAVLVVRTFAEAEML